MLGNIFCGRTNISTLHVIVFGKSSPIVSEHEPPFLVNTSLGIEGPFKRLAVLCGVAVSCISAGISTMLAPIGCRRLR